MVRTVWLSVDGRKSEVLACAKAGKHSLEKRGQVPWSDGNIYSANSNISGEAIFR